MSGLSKDARYVTAEQRVDEQRGRPAHRMGGDQVGRHGPAPHVRSARSPVAPAPAPVLRASSRARTARLGWISSDPASTRCRDHHPTASAGARRQPTLTKLPNIVEKAEAKAWLEMGEN